MAKLDKAALIDEVGQRRRVMIELGCGNRKRDREAIGIDALDLPGVDFVGDAEEALRLLPDQSVDQIGSYHFLEHLDDLAGFFAQAARVLKPGGRLLTVVPHFSNPFFYSDPTHRQYFGLYSFCYFAAYSGFSRTIPEYSRVESLEIRNIRLIFKSYPPHYGRHAVKKAAEWLFNLGNYSMEIYEENFCWLFPCFEIRCEIVKTG